MLNLIKYLVSVILILMMNASMVNASTITKKKETSGCALIASFDEYINHKWPELIDSGFSLSPRLNIHEAKDSYHIEAELPGVKKEDIDIILKDEYLVIKGEKKSIKEEAKNQYRRIERSHGAFYREIAIPKDADKDKITADLKDGILKLDIMKKKNTDDAHDIKILLQ